VKLESTIERLIGGMSITASPRLYPAASQGEELRDPVEAFDHRVEPGGDDVLGPRLYRRDHVLHGAPRLTSTVTALVDVKPEAAPDDIVDKVSAEAGNVAWKILARRNPGAARRNYGLHEPDQHATIGRHPYFLSVTEWCRARDAVGIDEVRPPPRHEPDSVGLLKAAHCARRIDDTAKARLL
jgi:hypothetical protein